MYRMIDTKIIRDNDYTDKCLVKDPLTNKTIITITFTRNDYNIIFVSNEEYGNIKTILIPFSLVKSNQSIVNDIQRVHPTTPVIYYNNFDIESYVNGMFG